MKIALVAGARPNFVKIASLTNELDKREHIEYMLIHTGQHYDDNLSRIFFDELNISKPKVNLGVGSGDRNFQLKEVYELIKPVFKEYSPDVVIVVGDVNSTLAAARAAKDLGVKIAHVEAGLRSFDNSMPEELNRIETDSISDFLFVTEESGVVNLRKDGVAEEKIHLVGNTMIDTLIRNLEKIKSTDVTDSLEVKSKEYAIATIHRPSNVDTKESLAKILEIFGEIQKKTVIVLPLHPRTRSSLESYDLMGELEAMENIKVVPPIGYLEFLSLVNNAKFVLTDSGGIQEETTFLEVPCLTLRENTERPITLDEGSNVLLGVDKELIMAEVKKINAGKFKPESKVPDFWDGRTGERVLDALERELS